MRANEDGTLRCPQCSDVDNSYSYLHHIEVTVYSRHEDAAQIRKTQVRDGQTVVEVVHSTGSGNPSSRRDRVAVMFGCELCGNTSRLTLAQHKGVTVAEWEPQGRWLRDEQP